MAQQDRSRDIAVGSVYDQIDAIYRRAVARSRRINAPLTQVEQSLLAFIGGNPGCRATDIASAFSLNRSTVSRQIHALAELGLVVEGDSDSQPRRGRALSVTEEGADRLKRSLAIHREAVRNRLDGWSEAELRDFAAALERFNGAKDEGQ
ncbi:MULTISPECIES: MarR family winged helix-turn-helix transcriptional regulator [Arthrobacter]|uniref:MarR family winged helix-turn-helix transcriptional regulator n=1 Tax=Arthrobacter sunyaminii TaxID=2816859 RepID=A0A975PDH6_9MICC|nr:MULTISPECIES: MarR family winged helix-turn-helix transcriptional regulator [Arthrobacter]MBO0895861.1 winged helix-turn-helix transcriptional regulator [Arthrobacter sunyaminii]MBO0907535.1 winged helix-turn-helix transcriptional regulator [Arthrobacter sunyaminii]QWQ35109.1 MarR family winged helix-turn-helix transcriptional regulator [Arthrobacter sunyaminii]